MATRLTGSTSTSRRSRPGPWPDDVLSRLDDALDALAATSRATDGVAALILFGSFARGDFGRRSDADLLALVVGGADATAAAVLTRAVADAETRFRLPMHLTLVVQDAAAPGALDPGLLHNVWTDGVVLHAQAAVLAQMRPAGLVPWTLVRYAITRLPPADRTRLMRRLHGRGGRPGLVQPPAVVLGPGVVLVPPEHRRAVLGALEEAGAVVDAVRVWRD
ncbi:MAG TPA: nucleotidyltransferase domain-containing protein [Chloroflexota bacterium]|jgi:predicted nucleotidyltransferase|nr:nucleotidyltransferase domain-containing protein [Chloroflexota bacterium]